MKRRQLLAGALSGLTFPLLSRAAQGPIKIGTFNPITGPASVIGDPETKAVRLWVDRINNAGGIRGIPLKLYEYDTQSKTALAVSFMRRLIETDQVHIVVGGGSSGEALAAAPFAERAGVPLVAMATTSKLVRPLQKWVFKVAADEFLTVSATLEHMKKHGLNRVAMLTSNSAFGVSGREAARTLVSQYGMELVADEQYGDQDSSMVAQLNKIKTTSPDATFVYGIGAAAALVTKTHRELSVPGELYVSTGNATERFLELAGSSAEGVRQGTVPLPIRDDLPKGSELRDVMDLLDQEYSGAYKTETPGFAATGYDGIQIALTALENASDPYDRASIRDSLEKITKLQCINGNFSYSPTDHAGLGIESVYMVVVRDGKFRWDQD